VVGAATPLEAIPVYVRPGAVVPLAPLVQHTGALPGGPLEVQVYAGADGSFTMYEDDGESVEYAERGAVRITQLQWNDASRTLRWRVSGNLTAAPRRFTHMHTTVFVAGGGQPTRSAIKALGDVGGAIVIESTPKVHFAACERTTPPVSLRPPSARVGVSSALVLAGLLSASVATVGVAIFLWRRARRRGLNARTRKRAAVVTMAAFERSVGQKTAWDLELNEAARQASAGSSAN